jgi:hypothetical protein
MFPQDTVESAHICPGNGFGSGTIHNPAFVIDTNNPGDLFTQRPSSKAVITLRPTVGLLPPGARLLPTRCRAAPRISSWGSVAPVMGSRPVTTAAGCAEEVR